MTKFLSFYTVATVFTSLASPLLLYNLALAEIPPREDSKENKTYSQGTRGCPAPLGQLALLQLSGSDGDYYLESGNLNPLVAFAVEGEQPERLSISVGELDDTLNYKSIAELELITSNQRVQFLSLPPLEVGKRYRITFQVICPQRWGYGRSLSIWVKRVGDIQTDYDEKVGQMWQENQSILKMGLSVNSR